MTEALIGSAVEICGFLLTAALQDVNSSYSSQELRFPVASFPLCSDI